MYKENYGNIPNKDKVRDMIEKAYQKNPGKWVIHSHIIGKTSEKIAGEIGLDPDIAYACGYLHDIGKSICPSGLSHMVAGYRILRDEGYFFPAKIALGHGFFENNLNSYEGARNVSERDLEIVKNFLFQREITAYDKLIILLDNLVKYEYLSFDQRQKDKDYPIKDEALLKRKREVIMTYKENLEKILEKPIKSYLPRPRYCKFPYNLVIKEK